jgi:hypothetical protein
MTGAVSKQDQKIGWLRGELDTLIRPPQLARGEIELKRPKPNYSA